MAGQKVTGPAHIYCGVGPNKSPLYLGTAERYPKISIRPHFKPTFTDIGGDVPFDMSFQGEEGFVSADISRWNEITYAIMAARPRHRHPLFPRGSTFNGDIGTLMLAEGAAYPIWVVFPYAAVNGGKAAFADMPAGFRFVSSYLMGPDELEPLGTTPQKERLIWHCLRSFYITTGGNARQFLLYDHDMRGLPSID
jgi:hypothetical protein